MPLPSTAARDAARAAAIRQPALVLELDLDTCTNVYGVTPCTAGRVQSGTAQGGGASSITLAAAASSADDAYNTMTVRITGGTGAGQERRIIDYVGATRVATVEAWSTAPDATSTYDVIDRPNACYNTFSTCQDKPNFAKGVKTIKFCTRGMPIPAGETIRPYVRDADAAVTIIDPDRGIARRATLSIALDDEPDSDVQTDPYLAERPSAPVGTFWPRLLRRNPNYVGRFARVRRGYAVSPWSWDTFLSELYLIEALNGPARGQVTLVLKDPLKLADRAKVPVPTDGKLAVALGAVAHAGTAQAGAASSITLASTASAVDDAYNGMEVLITENQGAGQRRVITDYVGATRVATVSPAWSVNPNGTSLYEVGALAAELGSGKGAQYPDPATSGKREFIRIGDEIIEYTGKSGDTLTWPDTTYRAQFGTARTDHKTDDAVQLCRAFVEEPYTDVVKALLNESGLSDTHIDTAALAAEEGNWYGGQYEITACVSEPEDPSSLLAELLEHGNAVLWWSPAEQKVRFATILPTSAAPPVWRDEDTFVENSVEIEALEDLRVTYVGAYFGLASATANRREAKSYTFASIAVDADAESANEYNDRRASVLYSRWFGAANQVAMGALVARRLNQLRDAPRRVRAQIDPKDYELAAGEQIDVQVRALVDVRGAPLATRAIITKTDDRGPLVDVEMRTTTLARRYGFIAPNGTPDYPTDQTYAHVAQNTGLMSDGLSGYLII